MEESLVKELTRLQVQMENVQKTIDELKMVIQPVKSPILPVTGGVVGLLAMVWTAYLQTSGQG
jgi:hypothetical protein